MYKLTELHSNYTTALAALKYKEHIIGVTDLAFIKRVDPHLFNQKETPFTAEGREKHMKRTRKKPRQFRLDWIFGADALATKRLLANRKKSKRSRTLYNFEFYLNRAYAFNRDKGRCRICGHEIAPQEIETHHERPHLPSDKINRVTNLASLHDKCHNILHNHTLDVTQLINLGYTPIQVKKIQAFRDKLVEK